VLEPFGQHGAVDPVRKKGLLFERPPPSTLAPEDQLSFWTLHDSFPQTLPRLPFSSFHLKIKERSSNHHFHRQEGSLLLLGFRLFSLMFL